MRFPRGRTRDSAAFTLLEIMLAMAIFSVVMVAIYSSWHAIIKGSKVATDAAASAQRARISLRAIQDALLSTCMFNANVSYYAFIVDSSGDNSAMSFVARLPKSFPRSGEFGDFDLRRLDFTVENGADGQKDLVLRQRPILLEPYKNETQTPLILAKNVDKFIIEFLDNKTGDWVSDWEYTNQLPKMVRVTLGLGKIDRFSREPQEVSVAVVTLPAQAVRPDWQLAGIGQPGNLNPGQSNGINNNGVQNGNNGLGNQRTIDANNPGGGGTVFPIK